MLHRQQGSSDLLACPVLSEGPAGAKKDFLASQEPGQPSPQVQAILSLEDLDRHRRSVLRLAQQEGVDLTIGKE